LGEIYSQALGDPTYPDKAINVCTSRIRIFHEKQFKCERFIVETEIVEYYSSLTRTARKVITNVL